jgi:transcription factor WhiB
MPGNANPGARQRAEGELRADPARSNYVIARRARCTPQRVGIWRRELEAAGVIEAVPVASRTAKPRPQRIPSGRRGPRPCRTREAIAALGTSATPRQVADLAQVSIQAAWKMLRTIQRVTSAADLAASSETFSVVKTISATCPQCRSEFTLGLGGQQMYCTPACRHDAKKARARPKPKPAPPPVLVTPRLGMVRACSPIALTGVEFPTGWPGESPASIRICTTWCPALKKCRSWALSLPEQPPGVLGGLTQAEREAHAAGRQTGS